MTQYRLLIDIQFALNPEKFKISQLVDDASGVSEVTDEGVRDAVTARLIRIDWAELGLLPLQSIITIRVPSTAGEYPLVYLPADSGVTAV